MSIFGPCEHLEQYGHHDYVVDEESSDDSVIIRICRCCADVDVDPVMPDDPFPDPEDYYPPEEPTEPVDTIEVCDVVRYGKCERCDHPCESYFANKFWLED